MSTPTLIDRVRVYGMFLALPVGADFGWYEPGKVGKSFPYRKTSSHTFAHVNSISGQVAERGDFWEYYERRGWGNGEYLPYARPEAKEAPRPMQYITVSVPKLHSREYVEIIGYSPVSSRKQRRRARELAELLKSQGIPATVHIPEEEK